MKNVRSHVLKGLVVVSGFVGATSGYSQTVVETGEMRIEDRVYQILDKDMLKVTFEKSSEVLSDSALTSLADFVKATKDESRVERYLVATWADKDYPAKGELTEHERKLALGRSARIKHALEAAGATKVDTFEMTKHPNWIQRAFSTETAEIKGKGLSVTQREKLLKQIGKRLRDHGGPGTAVIVAKFKNEVVSH